MGDGGQNPLPIESDFDRNAVVSHRTSAISHPDKKKRRQL
jgi:hypothetical protein